MKQSIRYKVIKVAKKIGLNFDPSENPEFEMMRKTISDLSGKSLQFSVSWDTNGDWVAESINLPGIITGGSAEDKVDEMIKDAIFTYFAVPPKYCVDEAIKSASETKVIKQELYAYA